MNRERKKPYFNLKKIKSYERFFSLPRLSPSFLKTLIIPLFLAYNLTSCLENSGVSSRRRLVSNQENDQSKNEDPSNSNNNNAGRGDGSVGSLLDGILENGKSELRHIVDPFTGSYKTKVTIPKNFKGLLYLSGLNITGLNDKIISVRFRLGREREEIIVPATIGRGSGITPQTDVEVLILDMQDQPFKDVRLLYDLYDYNDYDSNDDGTEFGAGDDESAPTDDPRNSGLYCRGLQIEDDPTFTISTTNSACDQAGEVCLYAYAKVKDSGLYFPDNGILTAINPTEPALDIVGEGYASQNQTQLLEKCLPDIDNRPSIENTLQTTMSSSSISKVSYGDTGFGGGFTYLGPYRALNRAFWQVSGEAAFSDMTNAGTEPSGLFQAALNNAPTSTLGEPNAKAQAGIKSFLFPRAGQFSLRPGLEYIGFSDLTNALSAERTIKNLIAAGDTEFVDGCNIRVSNFDDSTNEGISSCNVSASIDLIYTNPDTGELVTLTSSKDLKLQLTRKSLTDYEGNEVNYNALQKCTNSNACGANECCFNERCWSKALVSQCLEDQPGEGNLSVGQGCSSDFQCSSLCCSSTARTCTVHNPLSDILCSKSPGQKCVTKEFCRKENIPKCFIVKSGLNAQGEPTCTRRCYFVPTFGECTNGTCVPPTVPDVPFFDPEDPNCEGAIDPPTDPANI